MTVADVLSGAARWCVELGDCVDLLSAIPNQGVDHVITDPPYEAESHTKNRRVSRGDHSAGFESFPIDFAAMDTSTRLACGEHFARICRRWCAVFCQLEGVPLWRNACEPHGLTHRRTCIWVKPDSAPQFTGDRPGHGFECFEVMHRKGASKWNGGGRRGVFTFNCGSQIRRPDEDHPTPKPLPLMMELVELFTDVDDVIVDPFAGSGTTLVAALRLGRRAIGIERDPKYHALAVERLTAEVSGSSLRSARAGQGALFGGDR